MKSFLAKLISRSMPPSAPIDLTWLDELANVDQLTAIESSTQRLQGYFADEKLDEAGRLRTQLVIDQVNRSRINKITQQFIDLQNIRPELESRISEVMYFYHRQIFVGYRSLAIQFFATADDVIFTYDRLPLVLGRALSAAYSMAKWRYFLQQPAAGMAWSEIFEIYKILEQESLLDFIVPLYRDEPDSHLGASFVQACMLGSLAQSGLNKLQVERVSKLLEKWIQWSKITKNYDDKKHLHYIDLSKDHAARRIRLFEPTINCRYWDTEQFSTKIDSAIEALDRGTLHDLEDIGPKDAMLDILTLLRSEWSREAYKRQRRAENRQKVFKNATVTYGFQEICDRLKKLGQSQSIPQKGVEYDLENRLMNHTVLKSAPNVLYRDLINERWMISDESPSGYGAMVGHKLPSTIKQGTLICMTIEDQPQQLIVGNVQSIKKLPGGQHQIGIKIISKQAGWVQLAHADSKLEKQGSDFKTMDDASVSSSKFQIFSGIHLPIEPGLSNCTSLLLPRIEFIENGIYQISQQHKKSIIQLGAAMDGKDNWVIVSYPE